MSFFCQYFSSFQSQLTNTHNKFKFVSGDVSTEVREKRQTESKYIDDRKVVCYYANWAVYRQGDAKFTPQNINPYLCTHLIYAFGGLGKDDTLVPFDEYQDIEKGETINIHIQVPIWMVNLSVFIYS